MRIVQARALMVGSCLAAAAACAGGTGPETDSNLPAATDRSRFRTVRLHEQDFRGLAVVRPRPAYPRQSIEQGTSGVAVATVLTTPEGRMDEVRVLEAPDRWIGEAMERALMQWVLPAPAVLDGEEEPRRSESKLMFYFVLEDGRGSVRAPDEMPAGAL